MQRLFLVIILLGLFACKANKPNKIYYDEIAYFEHDGRYTLSAVVGGILDFSTGCASVRNSKDEISLLIFSDKIEIIKIDSKTWSFNKVTLSEGDRLAFSGGYRDRLPIDRPDLTIPNEKCMTDRVAIVGHV